jgi:AAA family ATP:ADP antiporter
MLFFSYAFLMMLCYYLVKTLREPLLLATAPAQMKSYAYATVALLLLLIVPLYGIVFRRTSKQQLSRWVTGFFLVNLVVFYWLIHIEMDIGFAYYVWVGIFGVMIPAQFWAYAADTFNVRSGQRLFPVIMAGASAGGLVGPPLVGALYPILGPLPIMLLAMMVLVLTVPLIGWSRAAVPKDSRSVYQVPEPAEHRVFGGFSLIRRNRYLMLIAILIVLLNWVNTTGEYLLAEFVLRYADSLTAIDSTIDRGNVIAGFYANFYLIVNALTLLLQMFVVSRLFQWIGVNGTLIILPAIAIIGYGMMVFVPIFSIIRIVKIIENSTDYSVMNTSRHALFLPLTAAEKYESKIAIDTFFWRFGDVIQAAGIYIGLNLFGFHAEQFALLNMAVAAVWLVLAAQIGRHYVRQRRRVTIDEPPRLVRALEIQSAPAGRPFEFRLPLDSFMPADPGDVLSISARLVDGDAIPSWMSFDPLTLRFRGIPPEDISGDTWLTLRGTNTDGAWVESRFRMRHQ